MLVERLLQLIVLLALHEMRGLHNEFLHAVLLGALQRLLHVVNLLAVTSQNVVQNNLRGKRAAHTVIRECLCKVTLNAADILCAAVVIRGAEAHNQDFLLTDFVLIARVILAHISGVQTEIFR